MFVCPRPILAVFALCSLNACHCEPRPCDFHLPECVRVSFQHSAPETRRDPFILSSDGTLTFSPPVLLNLLPLKSFFAHCPWVLPCPPSYRIHASERGCMRHRILPPPRTMLTSQVSVVLHSTISSEKGSRNGTVSSLLAF